MIFLKTSSSVLLVNIKELPGAYWIAFYKATKYKSYVRQSFEFRNKPRIVFLIFFEITFIREYTEY